MKRLQVPKITKKMEKDHKKLIKPFAMFYAGDAPNLIPESARIIDWKITSDILVVQTSEGFHTYDFISCKGWKHLPIIKGK